MDVLGSVASDDDGSLLATMSPLTPSTSTESSDFGFPRAAQFIYSNMSHQTPLENLQMDMNMLWLLLSLASSMLWVIYISFYNSRVVGYFITKLVNRFSMKGVYFKIGEHLRSDLNFVRAVKC